MLMIFGWLLSLSMPPFSSWLLLWLLLTSLIGSVRFGLRDLLQSLRTKPLSSLTRVAIYGAGSAGLQLAAALRLANSHCVTLFVDDQYSGVDQLMGFRSNLRKFFNETDEFDRFYLQYHL